MTNYNSKYNFILESINLSKNWLIMCHVIRVNFLRSKTQKKMMKYCKERWCTKLIYQWVRRGRSVNAEESIPRLHGLSRLRNGLLRESCNIWRSGDYFGSWGLVLPGLRVWYKGTKTTADIISVFTVSLTLRFLLKQHKKKKTRGRKKSARTRKKEKKKEGNHK